MGRTHGSSALEAKEGPFGEGTLGVAGQSPIRTPKFITLAPVTIRLRHDQVALLADFERKIMSQRARGERRERITKSTIVRALIDVLPDLLRDTRGIADERALEQRIRSAGDCAVGDFARYPIGPTGLPDRVASPDADHHSSSRQRRRYP